MATITTTIREPKTFQQIQDQQNELGKNQTLESLNDNISKLIKAITDRDQKRETEQDRQLKMNQLELSKLQLRRAQLGLAKDEKYYSDYSRKWSEKNNFGTSIGLDKNTSGNIGAIGVSALTAGALNPVIVKNLLFPIMTPLMNVTKALATFPGLLPGLFHRTSGKSSSAVASDPDRRLHGKLDQILGAIKDKTRGNKKEKEEQEGLLSKLLKTLVLGAAGLTLVSAALGGEEGLVKNTLIEHGKAMLAGFVLGGWKGALVGLALDVFAKTTGIIPKETDKPTIIDVASDNARQKIEEWTGIEINEDQFNLAIAGMMIAGPKGMLVGYLLGNKTVKNAITSLKTEGIKGLKTFSDREILNAAKGTAFEGIPSDVIEGAIVGGAFGSIAGIQGFVAGALLGAVGGFVWDRYKNLNTMKEEGINTHFDWSKFDYVIDGTDGKTYSDFYEKYLTEKDDKGNYKYTSEQAKLLAKNEIHDLIDSGEIDNTKKEKTGFINQALGSINDIVLNAGDKINEIAGDLWNSAVEICKKAIKDLSEVDYTQLAENGLNWVSHVSKKIWNNAVGLCKSAVDWIKSDEAAEIGKAITQLCEDAVDWVIQMAIDLWNSAKNIGKQAIKYVGDKASQLYEKTINYITGEDKSEQQKKAELLNDKLSFSSTRYWGGTNSLYEALEDRGELDELKDKNKIPNQTFINKYELTGEEALALKMKMTGQDLNENQYIHLARGQVKLFEKLTNEEKEAILNSHDKETQEELVELMRQLVQKTDEANTDRKEGNKKNNGSVILSETYPEHQFSDNNNGNKAWG